MSFGRGREQQITIWEPVFGELLDADGTGNVFETDQEVEDTPTLYITLDDPLVEKFILDAVYWYMDFANAVTYELYLLRGKDADDVTNYSKIVFDSGPLMADAQGYLACKGQGKLPRVVYLHNAGKIYYMLDYTGASGDTKGFIRIEGRKLV